MAKVKLTKNALKMERDALKRYQRYLPTLLLKKQQLQMEMRTLQAKVMAKREEEDSLRTSMASWVGLYADWTCTVACRKCGMSKAISPVS